MSLRLIDKYEVIATLGRGSMGVVYKAQDPEIGRLVAIKTLRSVFLGEDAQGNEALKRFRQESRSAGKLRHPNIVTIFEAGRTENGSPYIVMEFIEGNSLEQIIAQRAPVGPTEVLHYLSQIASAIDYAHSQSVIHRDIKPSNVIVDIDYKPHLLDFGVAKLSDTSLTPAGTVVGTPSYMSPEQIRGEPLDSSADLFAFAVMAFELFTAHRPFPGKDFTTVVNNIIHKEPLSFADVGVSLPPGLESVLNKALSKDKSNRYASALEFVDKIASVFGIIVDGGGIVGGFRPEEELNSPVGDVLKTVVTGIEVNVPQNGSATHDKIAISAAEGMSPAAEKVLPPVSREANSPESCIEDVVKEKSASAKVDGVKTSELPPRRTESELPQASSDLGITRNTAKPISPRAIVGGAIALLGVIGAAYLYVTPKVDEREEVDVATDESEDNVDDSEERSAASASSLDILSLRPDQLASIEAVSSAISALTSSASSMLEREHFEVTSSVEIPESDVVASISSALSLGASQETVKPYSAEVPGLSTLTVDSVRQLPDMHLAFVLANPDRVSEEVLRAAISESKSKDDSKFTLLVGAVALSGSSLVKVDALRVLGAAPHNRRVEAQEVLKKSLEDPDFLVRGFAAKALGQVGDTGALKLLETRLLVETNETVKKILGVSIQALKTPKSVQ